MKINKYSEQFTSEEASFIVETFKKKSVLYTKFTQKEIAEMMGINQPQVSNWLTGKRLPSSSNLIKLADILNEYPEDLLHKLESVKEENNF